MSHPDDDFHYGCFHRRTRQNNAARSDKLSDIRLGFFGRRKAVLPPFLRLSHLTASVTFPRSIRSTQDPSYGHPQLPLDRVQDDCSIKATTDDTHHSPQNSYPTSSYIDHTKHAIILSLPHSRGVVQPPNSSRISSGALQTLPFNPTPGPRRTARHTIQPSISPTFNAASALARPPSLECFLSVAHTSLHQNSSFQTGHSCSRRHPTTVNHTTTCQVPHPYPDTRPLSMPASLNSTNRRAPSSSMHRISRSSHAERGAGTVTEGGSYSPYAPTSDLSSLIPNNCSTIGSSANADDGGSNDEGTIWLRPPIRPIGTPRNINPRLLPNSTAYFGYDQPATFLGVSNQRTSPNVPLCSYGHEPTTLRRRVSALTGDKRIQDKYTFSCCQSHRPPTEGFSECIHEDSMAVGSSEGSFLTPTGIPTLRCKKSVKDVAAKHDWVNGRRTKVELTEAMVSGGAIPDGLRDGVFRWARVRLIGKGAYGQVYLACNIATGGIFAVKQVEILPASNDVNETRHVSIVQALKSESDMLSELDHPNIVRYLGLHETQDHCSIFLEYVSGGSLAGCLRDHGKLDEEVTKSFTKQILNGLEYLHSKGILHRDLKSDNILVEPSGICKISDFGISKRIKDIHMNDMHTARRGTVFWMAPEVINPEKGGYNSKADIWSVGCIVFEMWTGQPPWGGEKNSMKVLLRMYQTPEAPPLPNGTSLSPLANEFREACFAINPDERLSSSDLQQHPYLVLQQDWTFHGFE